ncbi:MAG: tRNA epoxyqueuosine(34) reductase QueG [Gammaproteobacteria bacterium]|nr:tRNA epoxyqueuosine(34) reductase QueG [Gammaproteobacteria bacterium]
MTSTRSNHIDFQDLAGQIKRWGNELGFKRVGIADTELDRAETQLLHWLDQGMHGEMGYMARHGTKRSRPAELQPGTVRVISGSVDYFPPNARDPQAVLADESLGFISRYALGRDYHRFIRRRLQTLAHRIQDVVGPFGYRAFADSAPVLEKPLAQKAGLGWIGKHSNLINRECGSWFFLGELYTDLPLPVDTPAQEHCGTCNACIDVCPTNAIVAPFVVDARRCVSYLTIELHGPIPEQLRPLIGNRVFGCDDCQLVCPWNRFAQPSTESAFSARTYLDSPKLVDLFGWTEREFLDATEGSPIRRIGYERWLRNIAIALGNAATTCEIILALERRTQHPSTLVREHVTWALRRHRSHFMNESGSRIK